MNIFKGFVLSGLFLLLITETAKAACPGTVSFSYVQVCGGLTVNFSNTSSNAASIIASSWDFGDGSPLSSLTNPSHVYSTAGVFNVRLIITRSGGCLDTVFQNVTVRPVPVATFSFAPNNVCSGTAITFTNSSSGSGLLYSWNFGDGSPTDNSVNPTHVFTSSGSGMHNFNVVLTVTDAGGCTATQSQTVSIKQQPDVYFYEVMNWKHCSYNAVIKDTLKIDNMSPDKPTILSYVVNWGDGSPDTSMTVFNSATHIYTSLGTYPITITSTGANGCVTVFNQNLVIENTPIAGIAGPAAGTNLGCAPLGINFTNTSTFITSSTTTSINWGDGNNQTLPVGTPSGGTYNHTYTVSSCSQPLNQYIITLTVSNVCGISQASWAPVRVYEPPKANFTHTSPTCINTPITFYNYSARNTCAANPNSVYTWDFGDGTVIGPNLVNSSASPQQVLSHTYSTPGTYLVTLTAENPSLWGCGSTTFQQTIVIGDLFPDFKTDTSCVGQELTHFTNLSEDTIISITGYSWSFSSASPSGSSAANPNTTYTAAGNQSATLTVYANNGCSESITKPVYVWRLPNPNFNFTNRCEYDSIPFTDASTMSLDLAPLTSWSYHFDDGSPNDPNPNTDHLFPTHGEYRVTLTVTDANGCYRTGNYKTVTVYPKPTAAYTHSLACEDHTVNFINSSSSPQHLAHHYFTCAYGSCWWWCTYCEWLWNTNLNYEWTFGDGSPVSNLVNPNHIYTPAGTYNSSLIVTNVYGCMDTANVPVIVNIRPTSDFAADTVCLLDSTHFVNHTVINGGSAIGTSQWSFGDATSSGLTSPTHLYTSNGIFNTMLISTNTIGCKDTVVKPVRVFNLPVAAFSAPNHCLNDTLFPLDLSTPTDASLDQWIWNYGDGTIDTTNTPEHVYAGAGLYNLILTSIDTNACRRQVTHAVRVYDLPMANFGFSAGCMGYGVTFADSSVILNDSVNGLINQWYWDFGDGQDTTIANPIHTYGSVGTYSIDFIVNSQYGCADTLSKNINVYVPPHADFSHDTVCFRLGTSFSDLSIPMPATINEWIWQFGDGTTDSVADPTHTFPNAGLFNTTLTVFDTNGCHNEVVKPIRIDSLPALNFIAPHVCFGDTVFITNLSTATQGSAITVWGWQFGDGTNDNTEDPDPHFYSVDSTYHIMLFAENSLTCRDTLVKAVNVYQLPTASFAATQACQGLPVTFSDSSFNSIAVINAWNWQFGDSQSGTVQNPTHIYPYPGDTVYSVSLEITDIHGCTDTLSKMVKLNPKPISDFSATTACSKDTTFFADSTWAGGPLATWYWDFGDGTGSDVVQNPEYVYVSVSNPTIYNVSLIVSDVNGCRDTITKPVLLNPQPLADFRTDSVCFGLPTQFTSLTGSTGGAVMDWQYDFGDTLGTSSGVSDPLYEYPNSITHPYVYNARLISTDVNGCRDTIVKPVLVYPLPVPEFTMDTICFGNASPFNNLSYSNGGAIVSNLWNFGDGSGTSTDSNPTYAFNSYGNFVVTLTTADIHGCVDSVKHLAAIDSLPTPLMNISGVCAMDTTHFLSLSTANGGSISSFYWQFGDSYYSDLENPVHYYDSAGTYQVTLVVTNARGCADSISQALMISPAIMLDFVFDTVCAGTPTTLDDSLLLNTGSVLNSWNWTFGDGNTGTGSLVSHTYTEGGYFPVSLTAIDNNGCSKQVQHLVPVLPAPLDPVLSSNNPHFCENDNAFVFVLYNQSGATINWFESPGGILMGYGDTLQLGQLTAPLTVYAENVSTNGCHNVAGPVPVSVGVDGLPYVTLLSDMTANTAYTGQIVTFTASPANYQGYTFMVNHQIVQQGNSPVLTTNALNNNDLVSVVASNGVCDSPSDSLIMKILAIPNAFTPDGDGYNDVFVKGLDLEIVNRWGLRMYHGFEGWDGKYNGDLVEAGTYYYIIRLPLPEGGEKVLNGVVTLVKQ